MSITMLHILSLLVLLLLTIAVVFWLSRYAPQNDSSKTEPTNNGDNNPS